METKYVKYKEFLDSPLPEIDVNKASSKLDELYADTTLSFYDGHRDMDRLRGIVGYKKKMTYKEKQLIIDNYNRYESELYTIIVEGEKDINCLYATKDKRKRYQPYPLTFIEKSLIAFAVVAGVVLPIILSLLFGPEVFAIAAQNPLFFGPIFSLLFYTCMNMVIKEILTRKKYDKRVKTASRIYHLIHLIYEIEQEFPFTESKSIKKHFPWIISMDQMGQSLKNCNKIILTTPTNGL
jgi:hypothetical protein